MISKTYSPHQGVAVSSSSIHCIPLAKQMSILFTQDARWSQESNGLQTNGVQAAWSVGDVMLVFCYFCWLWDWRWLTLLAGHKKRISLMYWGYGTSLWTTLAEWIWKKRGVAFAWIHMQFIQSGSFIRIVLWFASRLPPNSTTKKIRDSHRIHR